MKIDPTAIVRSEISSMNVKIDAYSIVRENVKIGNNVVIHPHVIINENVEIGDGVEIFPGAVLGCDANKSKLEESTIKNGIEKYTTIGNNSKIGSHTKIYYNVAVGEKTNIDSDCLIGYPTSLTKKPLVIGQESKIRSHSIFYQGSNFGAQLTTGHRVTVREKTVAGKNFQIGTFCDIQGDCIIGDYVRFHSNVHIGKKSTIGSFVWIFPYVVLTNDPTPPSEYLIGSKICDYAVLATMSVVLPGITVGAKSLVGAHSLVTKNVPENMLVKGVPAKVCGPASAIKLRDGSGGPAYPWTTHFDRGYPPEIIEKWKGHV